MDKICEQCWNEGCRNKEELRKSKVDVCIDMYEHPEDWDFDSNPKPEYNFWDDRTWN